jgi:hypothetical protein
MAILILGGLSRTDGTMQDFLIDIDATYVISTSDQMTSVNLTGLGAKDLWT